MDRAPSSSWPEKLPYAAQYISNTFYAGPLDALDINANSEWDGWGLDGVSAFSEKDVVQVIATEDCNSHEHSCFVSTGVLSRAALPVCYWEVTITGSAPCTIGVGFHDFWGGTSVLYFGSGNIVVAGANASAAQPYSTGAVVGCCFIAPRSFFFTCNGNRQGIGMQLPGGFSSFNPLPSIILGFCRSTLVQSNFGKYPFLFDIAGLCALQQRIWQELPRELLLLFLDHTIALIDLSSNHEPPNAETRLAQRDMGCLSRVCWQWHSRCLSSSMNPFVLRSQSDTMYAARLHPSSLSTVRILHTQETSQLPSWMHAFFISPLPSRLVSTCEWTCYFHRDPSKSIPSHMVDVAFSSLRHFASLHTLRLGACTFDSWTSFARFILSLPQLRSLTCLGQSNWSDVDPAAVMQMWTRMRRLGTLDHVHIGAHYPEYQYGFIWLFLSRCPPRALVKRRAVYHAAPLQLGYDIRLVAEVLRASSYLCEVVELRASFTDVDWMLTGHNSLDIETVKYQFRHSGPSCHLTDIVYPQFNGWSEEKSRLGGALDHHLQALSATRQCNCKFELKDRGDRGEEVGAAIRAAMRQQNSIGLLKVEIDEGRLRGPRRVTRPS